MGNNFAVGNGISDGRTLLEHIISDREAEQQYSLYTLANHRKKGLLIDTYMQTGKEGVRKLAQQLLPKYMNNSCNITNKDQVKIQLENQIVTKRCWNLEDRGILGETLLHVLVFSNTVIHTEIAKLLLELYPNMALDIIEGEEYYGASPLHLSLAYGNHELTRILLESGTDPNQRATGRFFKPNDQKLAIPKRQSNFQGLCYLGEYPLFWAACCEDESSYNLLLKYGADPNLVDSFGNMVLHIIVVADKQSMYGYALKHPTFPAKDDSLNKYGLTPLTLACKLGRNGIFREMLELRSAEIWRYSTINCSCYPLNALDSLLPNGKTNWNSALLIILGGHTNEHLDMLDGGVIQRLLEEKWKTFARRQFLKRLSLVLVHLAVLSIAVFLRQGYATPLLGSTDVLSICRYCAEIGTCVGCLGFVIFQPAEEILAQGILAFFINLISNPPKSVFLVSSILILLCIPCRLTGDRFSEDMLLSLALPGSWFFLMFFAGAVRLTGPFVTMIYSILTGDMFRFSIIYITFLLAFTQAFYFLFKNQPSETKNKRFQTYPKTWISIFQMTLGNFEYDEIRRTFYHYLTQITFAIFLVFMPILLLNMLIAMMGNTYCQVIEQSEKEWMKQWAKIVVALERAINQKDAREYVETYSIPFASPNNSEPQRAVMVIRRKTKSKAKQRKGALKNWKRMGRKVIFNLKKFGEASTVNNVVTGDPRALPCSSGLDMPGLLDEAVSQIVLSKDLPPPATGNISQTNESCVIDHTSLVESHNNLVQTKSLESMTANVTLAPRSTTVQQNLEKGSCEITKNYFSHKEKLNQLNGSEEKIVNSLYSYSSDAFYSENETKPKQKKLKKRRAFSRSRVAPMEGSNQQCNSESEECNWTIGRKVERRNPRVRVRRTAKKAKKEPDGNIKLGKKRRKSKHTQMAENSTEHERMSLQHSIKQKGFSQRNTRNVVAMTSLVAWDESEEHS